MTRLITFLICACLATGVWAQSYPDPMSKTVNDFAGLLPPDAEQRIDADLSQLEKETGIEMTVVTLSRQEVFAPDMTFEDFATGLFNTWGIGDKTRNDGILVLVMHTDRAMRIELGRAYGNDWDSVAENVVDNSFLPDFRNDRYQQGIETGVSNVISRIARPFHAREEPPKPEGKSGWWAALIAVPVAFFMFFGRLKDRLTRCPQCGARGIHTSRQVTTSATLSSKGEGIKTTTCRSCDYHYSAPYVISRVRTSSGSGFGGGSSGGGGATGRW